MNAQVQARAHMLLMHEQIFTHASRYAAVCGQVCLPHNLLYLQQSATESFVDSSMRNSHALADACMGLLQCAYACR